MANRGRKYMDRLLGKNEGNESRDFTSGRDYGEDLYFHDDAFNDSNSEWNRNSDFRERPRRNQYRSHDYYAKEYNRDLSRRPDRNDRFYPRNYSNTGERYHSMRQGFFGKGPKGWKLSDDRIKEEVSEALYRDYSVDASEIEVEVKDSIVTLTGTVENRDSKRAAEECIENLTGVTDVHNRIRIMDKSNVSNIRKEEDEKRALS